MVFKNMLEWYIAVIKAYVVFNGRARRAEYWYFILTNFIIMILLSIVFVNILGKVSQIFTFVPTLYSLAVFLPTLGAAIRRFHDIGKSGWWIFVPIYNIYLLALDSTPGENKYGPNPKGM